MRTIHVAYGRLLEGNNRPSCGLKLITTPFRFCFVFVFLDKVSVWQPCNSICRKPNQQRRRLVSWSSMYCSTKVLFIVCSLLCVLYYTNAFCCFFVGSWNCNNSDAHYIDVYMLHHSKTETKTSFQGLGEKRSRIVRQSRLRFESPGHIRVTRRLRQFGWHLEAVVCIPDLNNNLPLKFAEREGRSIC